MKRRLRKVLFYLSLLVMGSVIVESDIIMGHHDADHLRNAAVHYFEEPKEKVEDDEE
jgi:hypothetical protein